MNKKYVQFFIDESRAQFVNCGYIKVQYDGLKSEEHPDIFKELEGMGFTICYVDAEHINGEQYLSSSEAFKLAKKLISKGFEWWPTESKKEEEK